MTNAFMRVLRTKGVSYRDTNGYQRRKVSNFIKYRLKEFIDYKQGTYYFKSTKHYDEALPIIERDLKLITRCRRSPVTRNKCVFNTGVCQL